MYNLRYLVTLFCIGAIQNSLAQQGNPQDRREGIYKFQYPQNFSAVYGDVKSQDRINVWFTLNGTAESTRLSIRCWPRSESRPPVSQYVFNETIATIEPEDFVEYGYNLVPYNSSNTTVELSKYAEYSPCAFNVRSLTAQNKTEDSELIYFSNGTETTSSGNASEPSEPEGSGRFYGMFPEDKTDGEDGEDGEGVNGASDASLVSSSVASLIVGLIVSLCLLV
ncbi:MAG: hypothetical protein Q9169_006818 [Polycauliona sp. 2 TL-2023]